MSIPSCSFPGCSHQNLWTISNNTGFPPYSKEPFTVCQKDLETNDSLSNIYEALVLGRLGRQNGSIIKTKEWDFSKIGSTWTNTNKKSCECGRIDEIWHKKTVEWVPDGYGYPYGFSQEKHIYKCSEHFFFPVPFIIYNINNNNTGVRPIEESWMKK